MPEKTYKGCFCEFCAVVRPQVLQNLKWTRWQHWKYKSPGGLVFLLGILAKAVTGAYQFYILNSKVEGCGVYFGHILIHTGCVDSDRQFLLDVAQVLILQRLGCAKLSVEAVLA